MEVVIALRSRGHNVLTATEAGNANVSIPDEQVLEYAIQTERALLTINRWDFVRLHKRNVRHFGIVACTQDADTTGQAERIHTAVEREGDLRGKLVRINRPHRQT